MTAGKVRAMFVSFSKSAQGAVVSCSKKSVSLPATADASSDAARAVRKSLVVGEDSSAKQDCHQAHRPLFQCPNICRNIYILSVNDPLSEIHMDKRKDALSIF